MAELKKMEIEEEELTVSESQERAEQEVLYAETFKNMDEGSVIEGTVISIQSDGVLIDIGYKSEGVVSKGEFASSEISQLQVGQKLRVYLEEREDANGHVILSKEKADRMKIWLDLEEMHKKDTVIEGKVLSRIKGGMIVDIGVKAFLPGSQIDLRPVRDLDYLVGKTFPMKIIKMNQRRSNIVVSRRVLLEESRDKKRQITLSFLQEGQVVEGTAKNITEYGVFVDLGGIDGLLHITDMSWGRVGHPSELFTVGDKISVMILKYDKETGRVSLGCKQKLPDPWSQVETKYSVRTKVNGKVVSLTDYGAFVELEPGVEGLVHVSEMSWTHDIKHPSKVVSVGESVSTVILNVDRKGRKISLGMKQATQNPWDAIDQRYPVGKKVAGKVRSLTDFGAFIGLEDGIDGLVHISDISWTRHVKHPSDVLKKGQPVEAVVLRVDKDKQRISLGYKHLTPDPWERVIPDQYPVGRIVQGKVVKITDFGVFLSLEDEIEGLIHVSESGVEAPARVEDVFHVLDVVEAKIIRVDSNERKIALSVLALRKDVEKEDLARFHSGQGRPDQPFGTIANQITKKIG